MEIIDLRKCATDFGDLCYPRINDDVLLSFANGLAVNRSVKHFLLDDMSDRIGPTGWSKFYQTLFGERILDTYHSNHALEKLHSDDEKSAWFNFLFPRDLRMCLSINRGNDRIQAARLKIIWKHFSGRVINVQPLTDMELNVLPHAIAWIGRDSNDHRREELSLMFQFVRSMPALLGRSQRVSTMIECCTSALTVDVSVVISKYVGLD